MARILVEYNPPISIESQQLIRNKVTESMRSNDETSCQYAIDTVAELLEERDMYDDINIIQKLISEGVDYIEF
jgi:hypothetical protein